jgi:hypothetical protein
LKERLKGQEFMDVNQFLQRVVAHENRARDHRSYIQFREGGSREKDKGHVNCVEGESTSDEDEEVCIAECVDTPKDKPISRSFSKPSPNKRDDIKYTFDVSKCDKLFDVL